MHTHAGPVSRVVAIGDVHGDLGKAVSCAVLAGVALPDGTWRRDVAPNTVVVQVGDQLDGSPRLPSSRRPSGRPGRGRGGAPAHDCREAVLGDIRVIHFFDELDRQARQAGRGCRVYSLLGNHEMNNAGGNTDYADVCARCRGTRRDHFRSGGELARHLAGTRHVCLAVGGVLFAHAGVCPRHLGRLRAACDATGAVLAGEATASQRRLVESHVTGPDGMLCHREYSPDAGEGGASTPEVEEVLRATGCNAMVLGHNAHEANGGISASHGGRVWVVDPGMSSSIFGAPAAILDVAVGVSGALSVRTLRSAGRG